MVTNLRKNNEQLKDLLAKREQLILKYPQLIKIQDEIELELIKAGNNPINRCATMNRLMRDSLNNLSNKMTDLTQTIHTFTKICEDELK